MTSGFSDMYENEIFTFLIHDCLSCIPVGLDSVMCLPRFCGCFSRFWFCFLSINRPAGKIVSSSNGPFCVERDVVNQPPPQLLSGCGAPVSWRQSQLVDELYDSSRRYTDSTSLVVKLSTNFRHLVVRSSLARSVDKPRRRFHLVRRLYVLELHRSDLLCCTTDPQQIETMEFELYCTHSATNCLHVQHGWLLVRVRSITFFIWDEKNHTIFSSPTGETWSIVMSTSVCLSVCSHISKTTAHGRTLPIFVCVSCGHGSVLLLRCCDILSTSGFVANVIFSHHGPMRTRIKHSAIFRRNLTGWQYQLDVRYSVW